MSFSTNLTVSRSSTNNLGGRKGKEKGRTEEEGERRRDEKGELILFQIPT
jgi:hypothetical protein